MIHTYISHFMVDLDSLVHHCLLQTIAILSGSLGGKPKLYAKGEGASEMVVDLVSTDYRWLWSPDGKEEVRVLFKTGKNQEQIRRDISQQMTSSSKQRRPLIFCKNIIRIKIMSWFMIMCQLTKNSLTVPYQPTKCPNTPQSQDQIG